MPATVVSIQTRRPVVHNDRDRYGHVFGDATPAADRDDRERDDPTRTMRMLAGVAISSAIILSLAAYGAWHLGRLVIARMV